MAHDEDLKLPLEGPPGRPKQFKKHPKGPISRSKPEQTPKAPGWKGTVSSRVRVSKKLPQAIVKITSHNSGRQNVLNRMNYISREGELPLETDDGLTLEGKEEIAAYMDGWAADFSKRKNSRDGVSIVLSVPPGTEQAPAIKSAREFLAEEFGENHNYVFVAHQDKEHFHIHAVVKMRGHNGKQLQTQKADLRRWRENFAKRARENGIHMDASPRYARGKGRKETKTVIHQIRARGETPRVDRLAAQEAVKAARGEAPARTEFDEKLAKTNARERVAFAQQAAEVVEAAKRLNDPSKQVQSMELAAEMARYADGMPVPKSRRAVMIDAIKPQGADQKPGIEAARPLIRKTEEGMRETLANITDAQLQKRAAKAHAQLAAVLQERDRGRPGPQVER